MKPKLRWFLVLALASLACQTIMDGALFAKSTSTSPGRRLTASDEY